MDFQTCGVDYASSGFIDGAVFGASSNHFLVAALCYYGPASVFRPSTLLTMFVGSIKAVKGLYFSKYGSGWGVSSALNIV